MSFCCLRDCSPCGCMIAFANQSQGLEKITTPKRRSQITASLKSFITHFFPALEKVHCLDSRQECSNIVRGLCTATPKGIGWRDDRSWMLVENIRWPEGCSETLGEVVV